LLSRSEGTTNLLNPLRSSPNAPAFQTQYAVANPTWDKMLSAIICKNYCVWGIKIKNCEARDENNVTGLVLMIYGDSGALLIYVYNLPFNQ
jgi:hypothetical protein